MSDLTFVEVITPADTRALMSLENAKTLLGISPADTTGDEQLQLLIEMNSALVGANCNNRIFGRDEVIEHWNCVAPVCCPDGSSRIWLTRWPVKKADIITVDGATLYEVDEVWGKMTLWGASPEIVVHYTGGYDLPTEAPPALQYALGLYLREQRTEAAQAAVTGIRMISHKSARVMFHNPAQGASSSSGGASASTRTAAQNLLSHFTRYEI